MRCFLAVLLVGVCVVAAYRSPLTATRKRYDGYKVLEVNAVDKKTIEYLHYLMINDVNVDFWEEPSRLGGDVTFMVSPAHLERITTDLKHNNIKYRVFLDNVQDTISPEWARIDKRVEGYVFDINDFNTLADIYAWLDTTAANCRSGLTCTVYSVGNSHLGNPIKVIKISAAGTNRRAYWLDSTIHAREWLAPATNLKIIDHLARGGDADAIRLTNTYDWYLMPVMNPDGYLYTWSNDRLWRKNRRPTAGSACIGTDLNRNFDFRWGTEGVSLNPCSDTFCGPTGGSEPETQGTSAELNRLGSSLLAMVTIHSYGNMWMFPWGTTENHNGLRCDLADDHADLMVVADATANAIENTYNTQWAQGNSCEVIYETSGGTDDYAKGVSGVKYAFCPELRGNGFVINNNQIDPSFREVWNGIVAMCDSISAKHNV